MGCVTTTTGFLPPCRSIRWTSARALDSPGRRSHRSSSAPASAFSMTGICFRRSIVSSNWTECKASPTAINSQPTGQGKAAISGDFVLLASEVNPVIRALRTHGIDVTAMHNHMLFEQPHLYFMHFWANDDAVKLAHGLRAALDETNSQKAQLK